MASNQQKDYPKQHRAWLRQCEINIEETQNNIDYYKKAIAINKKLVAALQEQQNLNKRIRRSGLSQFKRWEVGQKK